MKSHFSSLYEDVKSFGASELSECDIYKYFRELEHLIHLKRLLQQKTVRRRF